MKASTFEAKASKSLSLIAHFSKLIAHFSSLEGMQHLTAKTALREEAEDGVLQ